jgi:hypothetical protein
MEAWAPAVIVQHLVANLAAWSPARRDGIALTCPC